MEARLREEESMFGLFYMIICMVFLTCTIFYHSLICNLLFIIHLSYDFIFIVYLFMSVYADKHIISHPSTSFTGVLILVVWSVEQIKNSVVARIPFNRSYPSTLLFSSDKVS